MGGRTDGAVNEVDVSNKRNERAKDESAEPVTSVRVPWEMKPTCHGRIWITDFPSG